MCQYVHYEACVVLMKCWLYSFVLNIFFLHQVFSDILDLIFMIVKNLLLKSF